MSIGFWIASAAGWDERRRAPLKRLQEQLPQAVTVVSEVKEHSSVWSKRLYARALASPHSHHCFLNDDVILCPNFADIVHAMIEAVPDQPMSLATICKEAAGYDGAWLRSYLCTGPAYIYPTEGLRTLVALYETLPAVMRERMNEDEVASHHAWSRQRPFWQSIPALVKHDTTVPSTLGYDHHANRVTCAPIADASVDFTRPHYWYVTDTDPPLVPHPWLPVSQLLSTQRAIAGINDPHACVYCAQRPGFFSSAMTGAQICAHCIRNINNHVFDNLRAG